MAIITKVGFCDFREEFKIIKKKFSNEGLKALYEYLERYSEDIGENIELDVIALCCEYSEYKNIEEFNYNYNTEYIDYNDIIETIVISINKTSFIILDY